MNYYDKIEKWLKDNNYQNSNLKFDEINKVNISLSQVIHDFITDIPIISNGIYKLCSKCNKEYKVDIEENEKNYILTTNECPHCKNNDLIWIRLQKD